ncbi:hypothetical protein AB0F46_41295 [Streptomyces sp. NPDC026665]|uniref:hypothetical protein n=1 Tax=Streptomyces sp. NPDC026665 TaxID=3154798 RepID=UPI0033C413C4
MEAQKQIVTTDRHQWSLASPAHHTEVEKAVAVANQERAALASKGVPTGDVHVWSLDSKVIVSFDAERPKNPKRVGDLAEATDV